MRDPNEPSVLDHNAPYNEGEDGECCCYYCEKRRRQEHLEDMADQLYEERLKLTGPAAGEPQPFKFRTCGRVRVQRPVGRGSERWATKR